MTQTTSDAAEIMDIEFGGDPGCPELRAPERVKSQAAQAIHDARLAAGLAQTQLARLAGTTQSVISAWKTATTTGTPSRCWSASPPPCTAASKSASSPPCPP